MTNGVLILILCSYFNVFCSEQKAVSEEESATKQYRLSKDQAAELLENYHVTYKELSLEELGDQFGGSYATITDEESRFSEYTYSISTVVSWENEEMRRIDVTSFLSERKKDNSKSSNIITQKTLILQR